MERKKRGGTKDHKTLEVRGQTEETTPKEKQLNERIRGRIHENRQLKERG